MIERIAIFLSETYPRKLADLGLTPSSADGGDAGHLQDAAAALRSKVRCDGLAHPKRAEEVGIHDLACGLLGDFLDRSCQDVAGVVNHDVQPPGHLDGRCHRSEYSGAVTDIQ